uniref:Uncharacterized protein n=1 Tax=Anguilla anguilla TaxID=7936 RepID=A0A0E9V2X6_ANGAN
MHIAAITQNPTAHRTHLLDI